MPYKIDKVKGGFKVKSTDSGRYLSNKPLTQVGARKQRIAVALAESQRNHLGAGKYFA